MKQKIIYSCVENKGEDIVWFFTDETYNLDYVTNRKVLHATTHYGIRQSDRGLRRICNNMS